MATPHSKGVIPALIEYRMPFIFHDPFVAGIENRANAARPQKLRHGWIFGHKFCFAELEPCREGLLLQGPRESRPVSRDGAHRLNGSPLNERLWVQTACRSGVSFFSPRQHAARS